jgi:hypothetical protein
VTSENRESVEKCGYAGPTDRMWRSSCLISSSRSRLRSYSALSSAGGVLLPIPEIRSLILGFSIARLCLRQESAKVTLCWISSRTSGRTFLSPQSTHEQK